MAKATDMKSSGATRSRIKLAAPVSERVQVENILLFESAARRGEVRDRLPAHLTMNVNVQTKADREQGVILVRPRFMLAAKYENGGDDELLRIDAAFLLKYRLPSFKGLKKANFEAFGILNGVYNAWPYWREFVQSTTVRMGLPALTVPVYRPLDNAAESKQGRSRGPSKNGHGTTSAVLGEHRKSNGK